MFETDGFNELCLHFRLNAGLWGSKQLAQLAKVLFLRDYQHASHARLELMLLLTFQPLLTSSALVKRAASSA